MDKYITRSQWGAKSATGGAGWRYKKRGMSWHHGGSDTPPANHSDCAARVRSYQSQHMRGAWYDIAYNFLICKHGYIFEGRGWDEQTGANGTTYANRRYLATCFLGNGNKALTDRAKRAALRLRAEASKRGWGKANRPHSYFKSTGCPGSDVRSWLKSGMSAPRAGAEEEDDMFVEDGDRGDAVEYIQRMVNQCGASPQLETDGVYGDKTIKGVEQVTGNSGKKITPYRLLQIQRKAARGWVKAGNDGLTDKEVEAILDRALGDLKVVRG